MNSQKNVQHKFIMRMNIVRKYIPLVYLLTFVFGISIPVTATSGQTCKPESIVATTPTNRFVDYQNGVVEDTGTGLMWKKCVEGQVYADRTCEGDVERLNWEDSLARAQTINQTGGFAGYSDWRLPNVKELSSIVEFQCNEPAINTVVFPNMPYFLTLHNEYSSTFSTSTPVFENDTYIHVVKFKSGAVTTPYKKTSLLNVRLVRDVK